MVAYFIGHEDGDIFYSHEIGKRETWTPHIVNAAEYSSLYSAKRNERYLAWHRAEYEQIHISEIPPSPIYKVNLTMAEVAEMDDKRVYFLYHPKYGYVEKINFKTGYVNVCTDNFLDREYFTPIQIKLTLELMRLLSEGQEWKVMEFKYSNLRLVKQRYRFNTKEYRHKIIVKNTVTL